MNSTRDRTGVVIEHEMLGNMMTWFSHRFDETSALMVVNLGFGRTVLTRVHNVPKEVLDSQIEKGAKLRPVILDAVSTDTGASPILKRVLLDNTEFWLTTT